jgi:hypothetical protein
MAQCTFKGTSIITQAQGIWKPFKRGVFNRVINFRSLPRAFGDFAEDSHMEGAVHTLEIEFLNVVTGSVAGIFSAIDALYNPTTGQISKGTLVIQDPAGTVLHTIPNCIMLTPEPGEQALRALSVSVTSPGTATGWNLPFTLTFRQTNK